MRNNTFYNSVAYKERQAEIAIRNWQNGVYDLLRKREERKCTNEECGKIFSVKPSSPQKFCSRKCAAQINNAKKSNISIAAKEEIKKLYQKGLSMQEISNRTGWGLHRICYWLDKYNIPRRSPSEAAYAKWNPNGDPFRIKNKLNKNEILLKGLGLGLYLGEGDKSKNNTSVRLSNTDPHIIKKFKEFLIKIYNVKKKLGYSLVLFNDCDEKKAVEFWEKHLGIQRSQLGKIVEIPPQGKGTYRKKSEFGVLTITVTNKKLKEEIFKAMKEI